MASKKTKTAKKVVKKVAKKIPAKKKTSAKKGVMKSTPKKVPKESLVKTKKSVGKKSKTSAKKKKTVKKTLVVAMGDQCFWINSGPEVKDLIELKDILSEINKEQFIHHVNNMKNDFAVWVEDVLCDKKCADKIRRSKTIPAMIKNIERALLEYHY